MSRHASTSVAGADDTDARATTDDTNAQPDPASDDTQTSAAGTGTQAGASADAGTAASAGRARQDELRTLLARRTEEGRLGRAEKLADKVSLQVAEADLVIAAVGSYNVVIDAEARRLLHGCRDFQGQAREGRLCKHAAAVFLALDPAAALPMLRSLCAEGSAWGLEVVTRFGSNR